MSATEGLERLPEIERRCRGVALGLSWVRDPRLDEVPGEPDTPDYYLYGVLGAKNVGKSSLVAAMLGVEHSPEDGRDLGEGTRLPRVYAAPDLLPRILDAFAKAGVEAEAAPEAGRAADFDRIAFVDLPDIESRFQDHFETVQRIEERILGLVVVRTAESSFDTRFLDRLRAFARDERDLYFVMNKFDQWVDSRGGDVAEAEAVCADHLAEALRKLELDMARVYMTDARPRDARQAEGFHLGRLQDDLLRDKSTDELSRAKQRAWVHALSTWTLEARRSLDLEAGRAHLDAIVEASQRVAQEVVDAESAAPVARVVPAGVQESFRRFLERNLSTSAQAEVAESRLIRRVFFHRVEHLPLARLVAAPFELGGALLDTLRASLPRLPGAAVAALPGSDAAEGDEMVGGVAEAVNDAFFLDRTALARVYVDVPDEGVVSREEGARLLKGVLETWRRGREDQVCAGVRPPWVLTRLAMWVPPLWFALGRPLAQLWVAAQGPTGPSTALAVAALPGVLVELTAPSYLLYAGLCVLAFYLLVLASELRYAVRAAGDTRGLEDARRRQAAQVERAFWARLFGEAIPARFRRLEHAMTACEAQLERIEASLREVDAEAYESAAEQTRRSTGPAPVRQLAEAR